MKFVFSLFVVIFLTGVSQAHALDCIKEGLSATQYRGTVKEVTSIHPNGTEFSAFILELDTDDFCFVEADSVEMVKVQTTKTVQLNVAGSSKAIQTIAKSLIGKSAIVVGYFYLGHTAWHIEAAVVNVSDIYTAE